MALAVQQLWEGAEDRVLALAQNALHRATTMALGEVAGGVAEHEADQEA